MSNLLILSDETDLVSNPIIMVEKKYKKVLEQVDFKNLPATTFMPRNLNTFFLKSKEIGLTIHSLRVMAVLLVRLKQEQLRTKKEITLFENEWLTENEESESIMLKFFLKDFIPEGSKNYSVVTDALDSLAQTRKEEYVNEKGEKIVLTDNILGYSYNSKKKGIHITMRGYWYKIFIDLSRTSNEFPKSIIFKLSTINSITFYFWLKTVPLGTTTQLTIENINEKFKTTYDSFYEIERRLLKPFKEDFDRNSDLSFNFVLDRNKAHITPYETTNSIPDVYSQEDYSIRKALDFKKKKYKLSEMEYALLEDLYLRYSYSVVHTSSVRKRNLVKLEGREYIDELHKLIISYIKKNLKPFEIEHLNKNYPEKKREYNKKYYIR